MHVSRRPAVGIAVLAVLAMGAGSGMSAYAGGGGSKPAPVPTVQFSPSAAYSANEGTAIAVVLVRSTSTASGGSRVHVTAYDGSAVNGVDYSFPSGGSDYIIPNGALSYTFNIPTTHDGLWSPNKTFSLKLTPVAANDPQYATIGKKNSAVGTIINTDPAPTVHISNASAPEVAGNNVVFTVTRSTTDGLSSSVHYATSNLTGVAGTNYTATSGDLFWSAADTTSRTISVPVLDDGTVNGDKTFRVTLSNPVNATLSPSTATGTVTENDPSISINDVSAWQGGPEQFTVSIDHAVATPVTVHWATSPDLGTTAVSGVNNACPNVDYISSSDDVTIPAGSTSINVPDIATCTETENELDDGFVVNLTNPSYGSLSDAQGHALIKSTVPDHATLVLDTPGQVPLNGFQGVTVSAVNLSGDAIPNATLRAEIYRDRDANALYDEVLSGTFSTGSTGVVHGLYQNTEVNPSTDVLFYCIPGLDGATNTDCNVSTDTDGYLLDGGDKTIGEDTQLTGSGPSVASDFFKWVVPAP